MSGGTKTSDETKLVKKISNRISGDLAMIIDRELSIDSVEIERADARVSGEDAIHISYRLEFQIGDEVFGGCLLMPLPDAISVACYLMVMPDEGVKSQRKKKSLDRSTKDAMLEVSNFIGGSTDAVLRKWREGVQLSARSVGCQGVEAGAIPNFKYTPGSELVVGRIQATLGEFKSFEMILMLPAAILAEG